MAYVITEACISEVYASCVAVCPVDCIHFVPQMPEGFPHEGKPFMIIDPSICIDCSACMSECPIGAIVDISSASPDWADFNDQLAPLVVGNKTQARDPVETPRRSENKLVNS